MLNCQICFLGPPASGKGTICDALRTALDCQVITPGNIYRRLREEDSETGELVRESLKDGGICPDWLTNQIIREEAEKLKDFKLMLDGYPRTVVQLHYLLEHFDVKFILHVDAPYEMLLDAAINRIQCSVCGKVWSRNLGNNSCDCENREWKERFDDSAEMYPKRYKEYLKHTLPIVDIVQSMPNYKKIQCLGNDNAIQETLDWIRG